MRLYFASIAVVPFALAVGCSTAKVQSNSGSQSWIDQQNRDLSVLAETSVTPTGIQVYLAGDDLFKPGRSRLSDNGVQKIDALAAVLVKYPKDQVAILDYTDNSGSDARNLRLTKRRAKAVEVELVKQGVAEASLTTTGKGDADPRVANDTPEDRAKNRRAELDITQM